MKHLIAVALIALFAFTPVAQADDALDALAAKAARGAIEQFKDDKIQEDAIAVTVIDLRDASKPRTGNFRGAQDIGNVAVAECAVGRSDADVPVG